jgi:CBS domain-containing protein
MSCQGRLGRRESGRGGRGSKSGKKSQNSLAFQRPIRKNHSISTTGLVEAIQILDEVTFLFLETGKVHLAEGYAMATVRDLLAVKGSHVLSVGPDATVLDAAVLMNEHKIGSLVVIESGRLRGIITERDILHKVVGERRDPTVAQVQEVMTVEVVCCQLHTTVDEARGVMKNRRIRHMPVVEGDGRLQGLISIGDLNAHEASDKEMTIHLLREYIYGYD